MARAFITTHVETGPLEAKLALFTESGARSALRAGMTRIGNRGRRLVVQKETWLTNADIGKKSRVVGAVGFARIYPQGEDRHIIRWQDQGTGPRHKKSNGQYTGRVEPQYFFERASAELDAEADGIMDDAVNAALARAGLL